MTDYYAILGVNPTAEDIVIRAAYKALAQRYHPDRCAGSKEEAHRRMTELTEAFAIGFLIFLPFLIIDLVVSSTLMSMGMMMLPPVFISLPFKILLFVLVDGWELVTRALVESFH